MSILDYQTRQSAKHRGELLYDELCDAGERAKMNGKRVEAVIVGTQAYALINEWLTEANRQPKKLGDVSFCGREGIPILLDSENQMRAVALAVV